MNTTLILPTGYSEGLAFSGKAAGDMLKLLEQAQPVEQTSRHGSYGWWKMDPDRDFDPRVVLINRDPGDIGSASLREELAEAQQKLKRHADMIEAAEALEGGDETS